MNTFKQRNNTITLSNGQKFYRYDKGGKYYSRESITYQGETYYDAKRGDDDANMLSINVTVTETEEVDYESAKDIVVNEYQVL